MDRRVAKALVEEPAAAIQELEIRLVRLGAEEIQVAELEVAEELAVVVAVVALLGVEEPGEGGGGVD